MSVRTHHIPNLWYIAILIIGWIMSLPADLYARKNDIRFDHISTRDGLSQSTIHCILQDRKGFMWFGTWYGLNRYDGYKFVVYQNLPENPRSLSHNSVLSLCEDQSGMLWVGTFGGGLNRLDRKTEQFTRYRHASDDPRSLSGDEILAIHEDRSGTIWIGTSRGLNRFDPEADAETSG
ncbi:MAG: hypothetical protein B6245_19290 [Desulfobacteraceae bacterium 4572_88]|nr:MAG: hypothetical protein B6245_19290 [Desulfobacteraceae bacterium 4572_88]